MSGAAICLTALTLQITSYNGGVIGCPRDQYIATFNGVSSSWSVAPLQALKSQAGTERDPPAPGTDYGGRALTAQDDYGFDVHEQASRCQVGTAWPVYGDDSDRSRVRGHDLLHHDRDVVGTDVAGSRQHKLAYDQRWQQPPIFLSQLYLCQHTNRLLLRVPLGRAGQLRRRGASVQFN